MRSLVASLLFGCLLAACGTGPAPAPVPDRSAAPAAPPAVPPATPAPPAASGAAPAPGALRVAEIVAQRPTTGRYALIGYVSKVYLCPPCPPGAQCKPCMGDNLVLSDAPRRLGNYAEMGPDDVVVFGERAAIERLEIGARYRVQVDVRATRSTSQPMNDLALASAEPSP